MQIFFVSLRTTKLTGPAEIIELSDEGNGQSFLVFETEDNLQFKEWEGYALVVPAQGIVLGAGHPQKQQSGQYTCRFALTPQEIPEEDQKLFKEVKP